MKKKIIIILTAVLIPALLVTAFLISRNVCEKQGIGVNGKIQGGGAANLKETTLTFYLDGQDSEQMQDILREIEKRAKSELNIKLDFKFSLLDWYKIKEILASGGPCDAFMVSERDIDQLKETGIALKDITELFPRYAPGYFSKFTADDLKAVSIDGKIIAIPSNYPSVKRPCVIARNDLVEKYKIKDIKSYSDLEKYLNIVTQDGKNTFSIAPLKAASSVLDLFAIENDYVVFDSGMELVYKRNDPAMKIMAWEQTPECRSVVARINGWKAKGYIRDQNFPPVPLKMANILIGGCAAIVGAFDFGDVTGINYPYEFSKKCNYSIYPLYPDKTAQKEQLTPGIAFNANSNNVERAIMFIEWLQSKQENYDLLMYGIKDKDYMLYGDQVKVISGSILNLPQYDWRYAFKNISYERTNVSLPPDIKKTYIDFINLNAKYPPHFGFNPNEEKLSEEDPASSMSFQTAGKEEDDVYNGKCTVDEYIKDRKDAGIDTYIKELQKQLDVWRAKNGK